MSLAAAEVALADQDHVKEAVRVNREGLSMLTQACDELGLGYIPSAGNFLAVDFGRDAMPIYDALLHQGVIVRPIGVYEMPNHLRVTVGTADENQRFIEALKRVLAAVGSQ